MKTTIVFSLAALVPYAHAHSWVSTLAGGIQRGGDINPTDEDSTYLFCPTASLTQCQPPASSHITLTAQNQHPCKVGESPVWGSGVAGQPINIQWHSKGHDNSQSDGTCVTVMIAPFSEDPSFSSFTTIASCLPYYTPGNTPDTSADVVLPAGLASGQYTAFWMWDFAGFWYTSCVDINVSNGDSSDSFAAAAAAKSGKTSAVQPVHAVPGSPVAAVPKSVPAATAAPVVPAAPTSTSTSTQLDSHGHPIYTDSLYSQDDQLYNNQGCSGLRNPDAYCTRKYGEGIYCQYSANKDDCGRNVCHQQDITTLTACDRGHKLL